MGSSLALRGLTLAAMLTTGGILAQAEGGGDRLTGETCLDAIPIGNVEFSTTGDTSDYLNSYDEACPWGGGAAPDVVYSFTPAADIYVDITLAGSQYDTKLYVYAATCEGAPVACNDDSTDPNTGIPVTTSSIFGLALTHGVIYFIVVDGYGSEHGAYHLRMSEAAPAPACPPEALGGQSVEIDDWRTSTSDQGAGFASYERFSGLLAPICDVHWWGINSIYLGGWTDCFKSLERFDVTLYADAGGQPGSVLHSWEGRPTKTDTGFTFDGAPLYYYTMDVAPCAEMSDGWISIVSQIGGQECWFLWAGGRGGDGTALQYDEASDVWRLVANDLSFCLTGTYTPVYGACCDETTGTCEDNVEIAKCRGLNQRFTLDTLCADLDPPCQLDVGACCYDNGTCQQLTHRDCLTQGGDMNCDGVVNFFDINPFVLALLQPAEYSAQFPNCWLLNADCNGSGAGDFYDINPFVQQVLSGGLPRQWLGARTSCADCPCSVGCPALAVPEAEECGANTNDGCVTAEPGFEPLVCGTTVCGSVWADRAVADADWYEIHVTRSAEELIVTLNAEFPALCGLAKQTLPGTPGCDNLTGGLSVQMEPAACTPTVMTACVSPGTYYLMVAPQPGTFEPCRAAYTLALTCLPCSIPIGACCLNTGVCVADQSEPLCASMSGLWLGDGVVCARSNCPAPDAGDHCLDPIVINIPSQLRYTDTGQSTCERHDDYYQTCLGSYDEGQDIIYKLVVSDPNGIDLQITLDPKGSPRSALVLDDSCPPGSNCLAMSKRSSAGPHSIACRAFMPGTYYLMVDQGIADACIPNFDLTIEECVPAPGRCCYGNPLVCAELTELDCLAHSDSVWDAEATCADPCPEFLADTCANARIIAATPYVGTVDNEPALANPPCGECDLFDYSPTMQNDVWWTWTAPGDGYAIAKATPSGYNMIFVIWKDPNCANLQSEASFRCAMHTDDINNVETLGFDVLAGEKYFFQIGDSGKLHGGGPTTLELLFSSTEGACCFRDGTCTDDHVTAADCLAAGGVYQGDGTTCTPNDCPQPTPGDDCSTPYELTLDAASLPLVDANNTTCGRDNDYDGTCLDHFDSGEDMIYRLIVTEPLLVDILIDPHDTQWSALVLDDTCPPDAALCIAQHTQSAASQHGLRGIDLQPGTYYLMADTWAPPTCLPSFDLTIQASLPCATCPQGSPTTPEGEPECGDDYLDEFNGGCNSHPEIFSTIDCGQTICGTSGTFLVEDPNQPGVYWQYRDTDWYEYVSPGNEQFQWEVTAEFPVSGVILRVVNDDPNACIGYQVVDQDAVDECETTLAMSGCMQDDGAYWFVVLPNAVSDVPCGAQYIATLDCAPCEPDEYCPASTNYCKYEYISRVTFGTIDNDSSDPQCTGYQDFTGLTTQVVPDQAQLMTVEGTNLVPLDKVNVWVDWNQDQDLTDNPPVALTRQTGTNVFSGNITPPANAAPGPTRMRIRLEYSTSVGPCGVSAFGQVEDYTVEVTPP